MFRRPNATENTVPGAMAGAGCGAHGDTASSSENREVALNLLFHRHVGEVYLYVHRRCRDHALAEDVVQDVFMTVARRIDDPSTIGVGWLKRAASNRMIDLLRRRTNYERKLRLLNASTRNTSDETVGESAVELALDSLSQLHRTVLTLHYLDGLRVADLAVRLDRTPKAVEGLLTRARAALRMAMEASDG